MLVIQILILTILLLIVPFLVGNMFPMAERGRGRLFFRWITGQFVLWIGAEALSVAFVARKIPFEKAFVLYWCYLAAVLCFVCGVTIRQRIRSGKQPFPSVSKVHKTVGSIGLWILFQCVLVAQFAGIVYVYEKAPIMSRAAVFTVDTPFSLWIRFLGEVSGMAPMRVKEEVMPIVFLCMSYGVFYLIGAMIFVKKRLRHPLFMVGLGLLVLCGGSLTYFFQRQVWSSARENSELTMLGMIFVPYIVLLIVMLVRKMRKKALNK